MLFTADHEEPRRALQKFIANEINPFVDEWEKADIFPAHELFKKLGGLGFLGLNKPEAFGGQGLDYSYALMMAEELGAIHCGGVPMAIGVQTDMATPALARFGSDEVRRESWRLRSRAMRSPVLVFPSRVRARMSPRSRPMRALTAMTT
jgi:citronellyl-CoA dehydrogenase